MDFNDFSFPQVLTDLALTAVETDLFSTVSSGTPRAEFVATLNEGARVALGSSTDKARSEFIIAPVLLELRRMLNGAVGIFSGVELDVDAARGLTGVYDFLLTKGPGQFAVSAPLIAVVEAKNDNLRSGLGQCIAATCAAQLYNQQAGGPAGPVHGLVTTGSAWQFLRLEGTVVSLDVREYYLDNVPKLLAILEHIIRTS